MTRQINSLQEQVRYNTVFLRASDLRGQDVQKIRQRLRNDDKIMSNRAFFQFIGYLGKNFPGSSLLYLLVTLISALLDASTALLVAPIFDLLLKDHTAPEKMSSYTQFTLHWVEQLGLPQSVLMMMFIFLGVVVVRNIFLVISDSTSVYIKENMAYRLKTQVFDAVLNANWEFFLKGNQGEFLNVLTREINQTQYCFVYFAIFLTYFFQIILFTAVAFWVSWKLTLFCVSLAFALIAPFLFMTRWNYKWGQKSVVQASLANGIVQETFSLAKVIQAFANQNIIMKHLETAQKRLLKLTFLSQSMTALIHQAYYPLGLFSVIMGYYLSLKLKLNFSELTIILFSMWKSIPVLSSLVRQMGRVSETLPSFAKVIELQAAASAQRMSSGSRKFTHLRTGIELQKVSFTYPESPTAALQEVSLRLPRGQMIALVGRSGSGKSTLVDIIMGFHSIQSGAFEIDEQPFANLELSSYRRKIGYVPQNSALFNTSIRNNFLWIYPDLNEKDILWACQQAHALSFIQNFPQGLDTVVGDRGVRLSGGQVQRLALARAIANRPELLILDEATSALDSESEQFIQESIETLSAEMTILVIAHRLSTIKKADYIYVLDQGKVIESGSFKTLETHQGLFQMMLEKQNL